MFSEKFKSLRKSRNLTQEKMGKVLCVSRSAVAKWEQGKGIPNKQSILDICCYFNISKEELFDENDTETIIDNLSKENSKSKKKNIILLSIVFVLLVIIVLLIVFPLEKKETVIEDSFYSDDTLGKYNLQYLKAIEFDDAICVNETDFVAQIKNKNIFEDYVEYVFNYLLTAPNISRVSFLTWAPTKNDMHGHSYYLVPSSNITDFKLDPRMDCYYFYFIINFPKNHNQQDRVEVVEIKMDYSEDNKKIYYNGFENHYIADFIMSIKACSSENDYYLIEEFYDYSNIEVNNDNVLDYFYLDVSKFHINLISEKYLFFANMNVRLSITIINDNGDKFTANCDRKFFIQTYKPGDIQQVFFSVNNESFGLESLDGWQILDIKVLMLEYSHVYFVE